MAADSQDVSKPAPLPATRRRPRIPAVDSELALAERMNPEGDRVPRALATCPAAN